MDPDRCSSGNRQGAVQNLQKALEVGESTKKNFHIRQALQLLALEGKKDS